MLGGKLLHQESCPFKTTWDTPLPEEIADQWRKEKKGLPDVVSSKCSILLYQEEIDEIQLHTFSDASGHAVCTAVYAIVKQELGLSQGLVIAKSLSRTYNPSFRTCVIWH